VTTRFFFQFKHFEGNAYLLQQFTPPRTFGSQVNGLVCQSHIFRDADRR
jgi:hypothetical protein